MTRNLKALGMAVIALVAMSALVASAASAKTTVFKSSNAVETKVSGTQPVGKPHIFTSTAGEVTCESASFSGTQKGAEATQITIAPVYSNCHIIILGSTVSAKVNTNGCDYLFTLDNGSGPSPYTGIVHVVCPEGVSGIKVEASGCTVTVPPQTLKIDYTNGVNATTKKEDILVNSTGNAEVKYSHTGFLCGTGSGTAGTYKGEVTVNGVDSGNTPVDITVQTNP